MATLHDPDRDWVWPADLAAYDPQRWSAMSWRLARCEWVAKYSRLAALNELRAAHGRAPFRVSPFVGPDC